VLGTEAEKVHEPGVRSGAAVPQERDRARWLARRAVHRVRHEEHVAVHVARFIVANRDAPRARRIGDRAGADGDLVPRGDDRVGRVGRICRLRRCRRLRQGGASDRRQETPHHESASSSLSMSAWSLNTDGESLMKYLETRAFTFARSSFCCTGAPSLMAKVM